MRFAVVLMQGISGAGKTWSVKNALPTMLGAKGQKIFKILSADDFFTDPNTKEYKYDKTRIGEAHGWCLRNYLNEVKFLAEAPILNEEFAGIVPVIVVDNTNCSIAEMAPYMAIAQAYGGEATIYSVDCDPKLAFERTDHGVDGLTIGMMYQTMRVNNALLPSWWDVSKIVVVDDEKEQAPAA